MADANLYVNYSIPVDYGEPMEQKTQIIVPQNENDLFEIRTVFVSQVTGKNVTSRLQYRATKEATEKAFRKLVANKTPIENIPIVLPRNCCYFESTPTHQKFLIEVPPGIFTIKYLDAIDQYLEGKVARGEAVEGSKIKEASVAIPWQYFWMVFAAVPENEFGVTHSLENSWLFWSHGRMEHIDTQYVYPAMLPNIYYKDGKICLGDAFPPSNLPTLVRAEHIANDFYESLFNIDLDIHVPYPTMKEWEDVSKIDKYCWMNWRPSNRMAPMGNFVQLRSGANAPAQNLIETTELWRLLYNAISTARG